MTRPRPSRPGGTPRRPGEQVAGGGRRARREAVRASRAASRRAVGGRQHAADADDRLGARRPPVRPAAPPVDPAAPVSSTPIQRHRGGSWVGSMPSAQVRAGAAGGVRQRGGDRGRRQAGETARGSRKAERSPPDRSPAPDSGRRASMSGHQGERGVAHLQLCGRASSPGAPVMPIGVAPPAACSRDSRAGGNPGSLDDHRCPRPGRRWRAPD